MRAIIIDDEKKGRIALRQKILDYCKEIEIIGEAEDGKMGYELINSKKPEIVFLDIEMPIMNGFEMLQQLKECNFHLIFTTAYDHYAIKAIKYSAFDYLLKPIDIEELKHTVQKLIHVNRRELKEQIDILTSNFNNEKPGLNKLAIPTMDGLFFYNISDLIYLEAQSNYTNLHFKDQKSILASKTMKEFEEILPSAMFFRPHHSFIINLHYVEKYIKGDGGQICLTNGAVVDVSRRHKEEFLKIIGR